MRHAVEFSVNGTPWAVDVVPADTLLDVLREKVGVKSPKIGCERGDCGSCSVLLDGRSVRACLVLAVETDGAEITTLEGLVHDGLGALRQRLVEMSSFQCGFCAPGIILAVHELMEEDPHPDRKQVEEAISGNLCRCTGYEPIVDAVMAVVGTGGATT